MNKPIILFRNSMAEENELEICSKYFDVITSRSDKRLQKSHLVIGRYSVLPYYSELVDDIRPSYLINSYQAHKYIANFEYYNMLKDVTPESWDDTNFYLCEHKGPFIVKGRTNSKKMQWSRCMFAETKRDAMRIAGDLIEDQHIGSQGIIYRKYIPLETYETGMNGLPFTNEWRLFFLGTKLLSYGYYWSIASDESKAIALRLGGISGGLDFAHRVAHKIYDANPALNFYVMDIARTTDNKWIMIELNDGQMSGLGENDPNVLYENLYKNLTEPQYLAK